MFSQDEVFESNRSGKWFIGITTFMMALFIFQSTLHIPQYILWAAYIICSCLFFFSTFEYIRRYYRLFYRLNIK